MSNFLQKFKQWSLDIFFGLWLGDDVFSFPPLSPATGDLNFKNKKFKHYGVKEAVFEPSKLAQSNRQGRKIMQSYFKKKGVAVAFSKSE